MLFPSKNTLYSSLQKFETISQRRNDPQKSTSRNKVLSITLDGALINQKNTDLRKTASKAFFKLMNNSVFGKTIENIRKRQNVKIVDNRKLANKLSSKPNFERVTIFDENLIACHMKKTEVYFNKPIYVGQAILHFRKL